MNCEMIGLLGGTFDPPHYGHLVLAMEALELFNLDRVILVPSRLPPHKDRVAVTPFEHRMQMAGAAAGGNPHLSVRDLEPRDGPSWTVNLVSRLAESGEDICFIMGMDSLLELHTWREPERIASLARLVAGIRPGYDASLVPKKYRDLVEVFQMPGVDISSSQLRIRFAEGGNTRYLLPECVRDYIRENDLYAKGKSR